MIEDGQLYKKADLLAHLVYQKTKTFPKEELFGITSQLRRAILSVPLNIIEGYSRKYSGDFNRFLTIAYGSLKEAKYLLKFSCDEKIISSSDYQECFQLAEETGRLLWVTLQSVNDR